MLYPHKEGFISTSCSKVFIILILIFRCSHASWTQQYGDSSSTNFINSSNHHSLPNVSVWNYTVHNEDSTSFFYGSPSVSEKGIVFIPFLELPEYWLQVRAVSPGGKELWMANWIGGDEACSVVDLSNILYSLEHKLVIVAWYCTAGGAYHKKAGQVVALNASNGSRVWQSPKLKLLDSSSISMSSDTVYIVSGYDCGRDNPVQSLNAKQSQERSSNKNDSIIAAIDLSSGNLMWTQGLEHAGCDGQLKLSSLQDGSVSLLIPYNLPYGPYLAGHLLAINCHQDKAASSINCSQIWQKNLHLSYDVKFAFTSNGKCVYGSYGFAGNPDLIFGLNAENGELLFSNHGYCDKGSYPSGPSVDATGIAYYNCGNSVFCVDTKGELIWKSEQFGSVGYTFGTFYKQSPSIHLDKELVVFSDVQGEFVHVLSMKDGKLKNSLNTTEFLSDSTFTEPPILYGDSVYIIKVTRFIDYFLFGILLL